MAVTEEIRMVVYYVDVDDFSHKEIAGIMNIPVGTVVSRLHRGRQRLRITHVLATQRGLVATWACGASSPSRYVREFCAHGVAPMSGLCIEKLSSSME